MRKVPPSGTSCWLKQPRKQPSLSKAAMKTTPGSAALTSQTASPSTAYALSMTAASFVASTLNVLQLYDVRGTFFVFEEDLLAQADNLRALVGQEQSIGLCVPAENAAEAAESLNELLSSLVLRRSRLVCIKEGSEALSAEQRQALHEAGYRLWDPSVSPQTDGMSAYALGRAAKTSIDGAPRIVCLGLHSDAACASALETILSYIRSGGSNCVPIEDWTTPVNASGDYT